VTGRKHQGRERKQKRKKIIITNKLDLQSMHAPHIQREDVEKKLKPPWNDFFGR